MYSAVWSPKLRQGDIVGPILVPLVGKELDVIASTRSVVEASVEAVPTKVILAADRRHVVVISHDCEFNEAKRPKLLVARLQSVPNNLDAADHEALRASNDIYSREQAGLPVAGVDNFVFDPVPGHIDVEQVVSFTTITPLPMAMAKDLQTAKCAELEHAVRLQFKHKLAWFFLRGDEDVPEDQKAPPSPKPVEDRQRRLVLPELGESRTVHR